MVAQPATNCVHHWDCDQPFQDKVFARCLKCGATTTFPANPPPSRQPFRLSARPSPRDRKETTVATSEQHPKYKRHLELLARKEEIIAEFHRQGDRGQPTARALGIPGSTLHGLLKRWGQEPGPQARSKEILQPAISCSSQGILAAVEKALTRYTTIESLTAYIQGLLDASRQQPPHQEPHR